jgi:hypothetical protein
MELNCVQRVNEINTVSRFRDHSKHCVLIDVNPEVVFSYNNLQAIVAGLRVS